ncbi:MAG: hypothetical protein FJW63_03090 [Actinobacteria bacterium]|nr:hypothetical protein [Actinomycetota bacterium]
MKRDIEKKLYDWKNSARRKPLILQGARQVGKTYTLKEFMTTMFSSMKKSREISFKCIVKVLMSSCKDNNNYFFILFNNSVCNLLLSLSIHKDTVSIFQMIN